MTADGYSASAWKNKLYFGDNLDILRAHVKDETVDLIYLDPPFNSNASYNVLFKEKSGKQSEAQITAFEDTWHWGEESERAYHDVVTSGPKNLANLVQALRSFLGQNDMMAYLTMMASRLVDLRRVLKSTGSIYLHCDPTASHYLKLVMDAIFDPVNFRNEILWKRTSAHSDSRRFARVHDVLLFYSKADNFVWNKVKIPANSSYFGAHDFMQDPDGKVFRLGDATAPGGRGPSYEWNGHTRNWRFTKDEMQRLHDQNLLQYTKSGMPRVKRYVEPSVSLGDAWTDIDPINSAARERLGYPTQKPEALLDRIISASSNENDLVLDPFCGCGTSVVAAERLKRRWIGIDITHLAITLMRHRLRDTFGGELAPYEVLGVPKDLESARALAEQNRYQFEWWALGLVDARPAQDKRKGADRGVDGYINFFDDNSGKAKTIIVQVKSGHVQSGYVRDLKGVLEREKAPIGILITLEEPSRPMIEEAAASGFYEPEYFPGKLFPRLQILTLKDLLAGKEAQYPRFAPAVTFKRAERRRQIREEPAKLL